MIKDKELNDAYHEIVSLDVNFEKSTIRVRSKLCNKNKKFIGIKREQCFDEKTFIESSRIKAEKNISSSYINSQVLKEIKTIEKERKTSLKKSEKDSLKNSFKHRAISKEAIKIGKNKLNDIMNKVFSVKEIAELLLSEQ